MNRKVLIITYYWPPASGPGVQRWLKFVKYLQEFGWEPIVLTVRNGSYPFQDESLVKEVPDNIQIIYTRTLEPFKLYNLLRGKKGKEVEVGMGSIKQPSSALQIFSNFVRANFFIPDARVGWNYFVYPKALRVLQQEGVRHLVTTGPPHSTHLVGLRLKKELPQLNWVADFRDPWHNIVHNAFLNRRAWASKKDYQMESQVLKSADQVIVVSPGMKREFEDRSSNINIIPNGYDESDFQEVVSQGPTSVFSLEYIGNLKVSQNIETLWKVLRDLATEVPEFDQNFTLIFTGGVSEKVKRAIQKAGIQDLVTYRSFVPHQEAVQRMREADMLLLPIPIASTSKSLLTGKIFEYLASATPILSIGPPDGDAAAILRDCGRLPMLEYQNLEGMKKVLLRSFSDWQSRLGKSVKVGNRRHEQFSRRALTRRLVEILNSMP